MKKLFVIIMLMMASAAVFADPLDHLDWDKTYRAKLMVTEYEDEDSVFIDYTFTPALNYGVSEYGIQINFQIVDDYTVVFGEYPYHVFPMTNGFVLYIYEEYKAAAPYDHIMFLSLLPGGEN
jgi:hypothetical protein